MYIQNRNRLPDIEGQTGCRREERKSRLRITGAQAINVVVVGVVN